ncbi:hypothetical protein SLA2020_367770 [Shorea laevis]
MNLLPASSGTGCKISFVSDDGEAWIDHHFLVNDDYEISIVVTEVKPKAKHPKLINGSISLEEVPLYNYVAVSQPYDPAPPIASTSRERSENLKEVELPRKETACLRDINISSMKSCANFVLQLPVQLSGEVIEEITWAFKKRNIVSGRNKDCSIVDGFLPGYQA